MRGVFNLTLDAAHELPLLARSKQTGINKLRVLFTFLKISLKLFTIHRIRRIEQENILGFSISTFDYGALHFLFREIFVKNVYFFGRYKQKKLLIFDCGANVGMATFYFKWLYPDSEIYAFEPDPTTFRLLEKNIAQNGTRNVHLFNMALFARKGKANFFVDTQNPGWLTMSIFAKRFPNGRRIKVPADRLSSYIRRNVDFLKMDIEGAEDEVFKDLVRSKKIGLIKQMAVEYHFDKGDPSKFVRFLNFLKKGDFRIELSSEPGGNNSDLQDIMVYAYKNKK